MSLQLSLLDRVQIEDTLHKMYYAFNTARLKIWHDEVFAERIELDFRALFGGEVQDLSRDELVGYWTKLRNFAAWHSMSRLNNILPTSTATVDSYDVVDLFSNVLVYLRRDVPEKESSEAKCDAILEIAVKRQQGGEASGSATDPILWRVCKLSVTVTKQENYQAFWKDM